MLTLKHLITLWHVSILIDHCQGVCQCLVKVTELKKNHIIIIIIIIIINLSWSWATCWPVKNITEFKILKNQSWWCGSITFIMYAWHSVWWGMLESSIPHHTERYSHIINVMLPHHHDWLLRILNSVIF